MTKFFKRVSSFMKCSARSSDKKKNVRSYVKDAGFPVFDVSDDETAKYLQEKAAGFSKIKVS